MICKRVVLNALVGCFLAIAVAVELNCTSEGRCGNGANTPDDLSGLLQMKTSIGHGHYSPIPCHIHQTWKTSEWQLLPGWVQRSVASFKTQNPKCNHTLWSDADVSAFVKTNYPQHHSTFSSLNAVERADMFRYAVIHHVGGYYADVDVESQAPIETWGIPENMQLVVGYEIGHHLTEAERVAMNFIRTEQFEQWMFGAVAGHPALKRCLDLLEDRQVWGIENTFERTGPALFSDAVHEFLWRYRHQSQLLSVGNQEKGGFPLPAW
jgi:mannosyltransferase OCH1-like enzyme